MAEIQPMPVETKKPAKKVKEEKIEAPAPEQTPTPAAPVAETPAEESPAAEDPAEKAPTETTDPPAASTSDTPLTISYVKENWPRITERVDIPACKRSLMDGEISKVDGNEVTVDFRSNFHRNKVMEHDNRIEIEKIFQEFFGVAVKLLGRVKEIEIDSTISEDKDERAHQGIDGLPSEASPAPESEDLADQALEVFGGEFIEDED